MGGFGMTRHLCIPAVDVSKMDENRMAFVYKTVVQDPPQIFDVILRYLV